MIKYLKLAVLVLGLSIFAGCAKKSDETVQKTNSVNDQKTQLSEIPAKVENKKSAKVENKKSAKVENEKSKPLEDQKIQSEADFITNELVHVKGGSFNMGNNDINGNEGEKPVHTVSVKDFLISEYEITQYEWSQHMPAYFYDYGGGPNFPVYYVSWYETLVYSNKRSIAEGFLPCYTINGSTDPDVWGAIPKSNDKNWNAVVCDWNANGYRMPSEAEWEYAAKGGNQSKNYKFSGSNDYLKVSWMEENSGIRLHEVGKKQANELGLYDMSGNLYEWCWDWYGKYPNFAITNPHGPSTGKFRVERGGGWDRGVNASKVDSRYFFKPQTGYGGIGIRIARTL